MDGVYYFTVAIFVGLLLFPFIAAIYYSYEQNKKIYIPPRTQYTDQKPLTRAEDNKIQERNEKMKALSWQPLEQSNNIDGISNNEMIENSTRAESSQRFAEKTTTAPAKRKRTKAKIKSIDEMTGREFEFFCAEYLKKNGFIDVDVTPESGDWGADIIADDSNGNRWVFQCKRKKEKIGLSAIQEVVTAKIHYGADSTSVMTNSTFTDAALQLAKECGVILYSGDVLKAAI